MITLLVSLILFIPLSFISFVISERVNATHQTRVGRGIRFGSFFNQHVVDAIQEMRAFRSKSGLLILLFQFSGLIFFDLNFQSVLLIYLISNLVLLVLVSLNEAFEGKADLSIAKRIEFDRIQIQFCLAGLLALISSYACFSLSTTQSIPEVVYHFAALPFIIFFQIAGMILFGEYPFIYFEERKGWFRSARFYLWCLLSSKLFLGGELFVFDLYIKATLLFVLFRLVAIYFPLYRQKDLLKIALLYLIPLSIALWLMVMIAHGMLAAGGGNV